MKQYSTVLLISFLLTACSGLAPSLSPNVELTDCTVNGVSAQCGKHTVYEDRAAQNGRQIELNIVVLPATGEQAMPDPLFFFAGGPGGVASANASSFKTELSALNKTHDIVLIDQRGVGGSNPLSCPPLGDVSLLEGEKLASYYESCLKEFDTDLRWYTTKAYVDDVNEVRQALGYEKINIAGESYGATVVQVYLNEHPETVRTASILRGTLLEYPIFEHFADSSQRALDLVFARCEQDETCKEAFPALRSEFEAIQARVQEEPVPTQLWDAAAVKRIVITPDMFSNVIHYMLMGADTAARIPRLVHRAAVADDWNAIARFYLEQIKPLQMVVLQQAMPINILCTEPWAHYRPEQVTQNSAGSYFRAAQIAQAGLFEQFCPAIPAPEKQALYATPQVTNVPVLVLNAAEDPQNPPANVADAVRLYPNSLVLIEPYRAHFRTDWACSGDILTEFIGVGDVKAVKVDCIEKIAPAPFDVSP
ncbi:MAG: alpha/beta fold hydrolase [Anaerolineales bacterium]|nr:alpha/beta fold hydrolase [Anaerolineales bacterium]